jgi:excinuclease UvrABC ATPase subunit
LLEKQAAMVKHLTFEELTDCPDYIASLEQVVNLSASEDWFE